MVDWQGFYKWLEGKLTFQMFIIGATLFLMGVAKLMSQSSSSTVSEAQPKYKAVTQRFREPPSICYCWDCGRAIEMVGELAGKHCRMIRCPYCGSTNVWRARPSK